MAIHPVQDDQLDGAVPAVYKHKNQQKAKCLTILYVNLNENDLTISKGQLVGHGSMCSEKKSSKPVVNVLKPDTIDPAITEKLWNNLILDEKEFLPGYAHVTANLNEVKNKRSITWTDEMTNNFNTLK